MGFPSFRAAPSDQISTCHGSRPIGQRLHTRALGPPQGCDVPGNAGSCKSSVFKLEIEFQRRPILVRSLVGSHLKVAAIALVVRPAARDQAPSSAETNPPITPPRGEERILQTSIPRRSPGFPLRACRSNAQSGRLSSRRPPAFRFGRSGEEQVRERS